MSKEETESETAEARAAYLAGRQAFVAGRSNAKNPHPSGRTASISLLRVRWFNGWYDEKYKRFHEAA
jgi:ribosome modulation factor